MNYCHFVSVIIPCRNEEKFIEKCLDSVIAQDYPEEEMEILVIDGMSEDGTREIVEEYANRYPFIRLLDNHKKITPCAFNIGIKHSKGEIIVIMGAHALYKNDYISKCIKYLNEYEADNVGGVMITLPRENSFIGRAIANVLMCRFGVGNSDFRTGTNEPKYTDTVFGGCYRKEIFDRIGLFNEKLIKAQDRELNFRLREKGGKILLFPDIVCFYYARTNLFKYLKHIFEWGYWVFHVYKFIHKHLVFWRNFIPLIFVTSLLISFIGSFFLPFLSFVLISVVSLYFVTAFYFSIQIAIKEKNIRYIFFMPFFFFLTHVCYGTGSLLSLIKIFLSVNSKE